MLRTMCHPTPALGTRQGRSTQRTTPSDGPIAIALRVIRHGLLDGLAAQRRYKQLTSSGVPHDPALRAAVGCGDACSHRPQC
jgi:hypothetical protein